jgi:hypothetical protein
MKKHPVKDEPFYPDIHYGTEEEMLAWCEKEGITPRRDKNGFWNWDAAYLEYLSRPENEDGDAAIG